MTRGETTNHLALKTLAIVWAQAQGMFLAAPEVSFPHRRFRVDVAACCPVRKVPSRPPSESIASILKAAAVFECKRVRGDLIRDNRRRDLVSNRLKALEARRERLESLLRLHLPHLANGDSLLPEFDSYRLRDYRHAGYRKLVKQIATSRRGLINGTKFDRLLSYRLANLHYLVVDEDVVETHELPTGWGLLVRKENELELIRKPTWQNVPVEVQLIFLQRIAARKTFPSPGRENFS